MQPKLGILGSTRGTNLKGLLNALDDNILKASLEIVLSNKEHAGILEKAQSRGILNFFIESNQITREDYDRKLSAIFRQHQIDLIVLIGYMRILSDGFIATWRNKIINVHPSLLPKYAGGMDKQVHQAVLDNHENETGCTVHYVTEKVDAGPIIIQKKCSVLSNDTVESLRARVQQLEGEALIEAINQIGKNNV